MAVLRVLLILIGICLLLDTLLIGMVSNYNLGVLLPGLLGMPLILLGLFLPFLQAHLSEGWLAFIKWLYIGGYGLCALLFLSGWAIMDSAVKDAPPKRLDAVIVLGAGLRGEHPTLVLTRRLERTVAYLNENPNTIAILSGGQGEGETISEAKAMARYIKQRGIPESRYILEGRSRNTWENFSYSSKIIYEQMGKDARIGFITTDFHVYRAGKVASKQGIDAVGIPAPDVWYIAMNNRMRESFAIWGYALRGDI